MLGSTRGFAFLRVPGPLGGEIEGQGHQFRRLYAAKPPLGYSRRHKKMSMSWKSVLKCVVLQLQHVALRADLEVSIKKKMSGFAPRTEGVVSSASPSFARDNMFYLRVCVHIWLCFGTKCWFVNCVTLCFSCMLLRCSTFFVYNCAFTVFLVFCY